MAGSLRGRIWIDCLGVVVGEQRGAERFITGLVREVMSVAPEQAVVLVNRHSADFFDRVVGKERCIHIPISGRGRILRMIVQVVVGPLLSWLFRPRMYVSSSVFPPIAFACPTAAFLYDLLLFHYPESYGHTELWVRRSLLDTSVPHLTAVFTISHASASDIAARFRRELDSISIVPCGTDRALAPEVGPEADGQVLRSMGLVPGKYALGVLGGRTYKNQHGLARAARVLEELGRPDIQVVVVGDAIHVYRHMACPSNLKALGVVSDGVLTALYRNAGVMVFPSFFEGFGLPVIEAQAYGTPVVCSDIPVLREASGDAAIFVDPRSADSIAGGILAGLEDTALRLRLVSAGLDNAARYDWGHAARAFLDACEGAERRHKQRAGRKHPFIAAGS